MAQDHNTAARWFRRIVKLVLLLVMGLATYAFWPESVLEVRCGKVDEGSVEQWVASVQAGVVKAQRQASLRAVAAGRVSRAINPLTCTVLGQSVWAAASPKNRTV